jgi:outer membrane receptor for ferrienterochelin and colicin
MIKNSFPLYLKIKFVKNFKKIMSPIKPRLIILLISFLLTISSYAQKHTLSGYIRDIETGEELLGANININEIKTGTSTNLYGFYSLTVPDGTYEVVFSFIGYQETTKTIEINKDVSLNIDLKPTAFTTGEVVVSGERSDANVNSSRMSVEKIAVEDIKKLPAFMGEVDVMKTIQLLPGVQAAGEGNTGFYVRGGGPDQNLILLDEATVYNASHLFGFFSVFNADAIKGFELYKGGMPAQYGGRISSVMDISMNNGNMKSYDFEGGIGTISTRLTAQGPIVKDKASFLISGRRTYIDILVKPFVNKESPFRNSGYYFYDANLKLNYKFSDKDRIYLSGYYGKDVFNFSSTDAGFGMKIPWGNGIGSLRWNHLFSNKFFVNTTLLFSDYQFQTDVSMGTGEETTFRLIQSSGIRDYHFKQDYSFIPSPRHTIKFGTEYIYHQFTPNTLQIETEDTELDLGKSQKQFAHEAAVYIGDDFTVSEKLTIYAGLRASTFIQTGEFTRFVKDQYRLDNIDTIQYGPGEIVADYYSLEPRANIKYSLTSTSSIKASYMRNKQYIHLASLSASTLPTDLWVPSSDVVKPQIGTQYSIGYFRNFKDNLFETSLQIYYKDMDNLIEYADGALPMDQLNDNADNYFVSGTGQSYGMEVFIKKRYGDLTGWLGYTLSKTDRQFDEINEGEIFPAKYDRRHDLSLTLSYQINEKLSASAVFVYATGNTTTLPVARYTINGEIIEEYGPRNSYRMDPYHRLDLSVTWITKQTKKWESSWNFSIYNVYNRKNPYFIYFDYEGDASDGTFQTSAKQVSLFPILPAVTWNFKF